MSKIKVKNYDIIEENSINCLVFQENTLAFYFNEKLDQALLYVPCTRKYRVFHAKSQKSRQLEKLFEK